MLHVSGQSSGQTFLDRTGSEAIVATGFALRDRDDSAASGGIDATLDYSRATATAATSVDREPRRSSWREPILMTSPVLTVGADIPAPIERVYGIVADYRDGHPRIVPRPPFGDLEVEQGGVGAGTVVRFTIRVMGLRRSMRIEISEPEPGRVLVETETTAGAETTFTFEPIDDGRGTRVTISTRMRARAGWLGRLERALVARYLRPICVRELKNLAAVATG
jgi:hypothetical protein